MANGLSVQSVSGSAGALDYLQRAYGSANYAAWQMLPTDFWSLQPYVEAGVSSLNFFGTTYGTSGQNVMLTNLGTQSNFGPNHFLLKSINCSIFVKTWAVNTFAGLNADTLYSDIVNGFVWAGVLDLTIGARPFLQLPKPLLYASPGRGESVVKTSGPTTLTLTEATPNTLATLIGPPPYARLANKRKGNYLVDPNIFIPAQQTFALSISFPSGLVPVIGTGVTDDSSNPLYIGVQMSGILFRPVQ